MPVIRTSYTRILPLDPERFDYPFEEEHGWIDEEGVEIESDDYDLDEGMTPDESIVHQAVRFLTHEGAIEASSSFFHPKIWYSTEFSTVDYATGEEEERSFHLDGFTPAQERAIYDELIRTRFRGR
jgi:hypothetical protein